MCLQLKQNINRSIGNLHALCCSVPTTIYNRNDEAQYQIVPAGHTHISIYEHSEFLSSCITLPRRARIPDIVESQYHLRRRRLESAQHRPTNLSSRPLFDAEGVTVRCLGRHVLLVLPPVVSLLPLRYRPFSPKGFVYCTSGNGRNIPPNLREGGKGTRMTSSERRSRTG